MSLPSPQGAIVTAELVAQLQKIPSLPADSWYIVAAIVLCSLNERKETMTLFKLALESAADDIDRRRIAVRFREALVKLAPISGLPKPMTTILALKSVTPPELLDGKDVQTIRTRDFTETPASDVLARGAKFWDIVYGDKAASLMKALDTSGTPDVGASARMLYSFFQSNTSILTAQESQFVTFVGAIASDVQDVAFNHMRGAVHHGATLDEVNAVRKAAILVCEKAGMREGGRGWRTKIARL